MISSNIGRRGPRRPQASSEISLSLSHIRRCDPRALLVKVKDTEDRICTPRFDPILFDHSVFIVLGECPCFATDKQKLHTILRRVLVILYIKQASYMCMHNTTMKLASRSTQHSKLSISFKIVFMVPYSEDKAHYT
jgi:hypothetical protein